MALEARVVREHLAWGITKGAPAKRSVLLVAREECWRQTDTLTSKDARKILRPDTRDSSDIEIR